MINELDYVTFDLFQNFLQQFRLLSLHEYQSKNLLKKYGCCVQQYILAKSREEGEKLLNFETGLQFFPFSLIDFRNFSGFLRNNLVKKNSFNPLNDL